MENSRKEMMGHLKELVIPVLRSLGFKGSMPHFRRITSQRINLLTFQFDRYGGGFVIEIANCHTDGYLNAWGSRIEPNKLTAHNVNERMRIQANMETPDSSTDDWFRYDGNHSKSPDIYKQICTDLISKLPLAEEYWRVGEMN
jgi:hypothetical protein